MDPLYYYRRLAQAYIRGSCPDLDAPDDDALWAAAQARGLRLHRFKRNSELPRVRRVLSALKGFAPRSLLDIGSGRGTFLWPLLDEFPELTVVAIDKLEHRVADLEAVARGGVDRLQARRSDAGALPFDDDTFDAATVLEVLEHVEDPAPVATELLRVASTVVVATVPSKPDDNPEHIRLFRPETLRALFIDAGARSAQVSQVRDHLVAVVQP